MSIPVLKMDVKPSAVTQETIDRLGKGIKADTFIGVGIKVDNIALNKMFSSMNKMILDAEYSIVTSVAENLIDFSPVWTGDYVRNWNVNPNSPNRERVAAGFRSGAARRPNKLSDGDAAALRETKKQTMIDRIIAAMETERSDTGRGTKMKNSWFFTNTTPYAQAVESRHGVVAGAEVAAGTNISFALMDNGQ